MVGHVLAFYIQVHSWELIFIPAAYAIMVRTSEYDLSPEMLDDIVVQSISSYTDAGRQPAGRSRGDRMSDDDDDEN